MNNSFFHKQLTLISTILLLLGVYFGTQPDFREFYILGYKEIYIIVFGYLPTWGIIFTLSIRNILSTNKIKFTVYTILLYCLLHYSVLRIKPIEYTLFLSAIGALLTLAILKLSDNRFTIKTKDYFIITIVGVLAFLPWVFGSKLWYASLSVFIWQISIGHYCNYLKLKLERGKHTDLETK